MGIYGVENRMLSNELGDWLAVHFGLPCPVACRLLRSYTNDVYEVTCRDERYALKVYGPGWRTASEIQYEIALLRHVSARGLAVANPLPGSDNAFVQQLPCSGAARCAVLFEWATGEKPQPPFGLPLYRAFGQAIGNLHELSKDFTTPHHRPPLDIAPILDAPVAQVLPLLEKPKDQAFLADLARRVRERLTVFAAHGLDWGPIHGDATLDNLHVTADQTIILYDFDSGGPGWRAADLQGWTWDDAEYRARGEAFHDGYTRIRPLKEVDLAAAPYLTLAWDLWGLKVDLDNHILSQGAERTRKYLTDRLAALHTRHVVDTR